MANSKHWTLGTKLALIGIPFLLLALLSTASTLWVSWQLDGGAAAVNEAGRLRMQAYRLALTARTGDETVLPALVERFERSLELVRHGDTSRPLFTPWNDDSRQKFAAVEQSWSAFRDRWARTATPTGAETTLSVDTAAFAAQVDALVGSVEDELSHWTSLLHLLQMAIMALVVLGSALLLFVGFRFVLEPLGLLEQAIGRIDRGDLGARVARTSSDEFGTLADGFNGMAEHLQRMYRNLEAKVSEKTAELQEKRERLQALYDVTSMVTGAASLDELARGFATRVRGIAHADGVALRWADESTGRFLMLACDGLPEWMASAEQCIQAGDCHCGVPVAKPGARTVPIHALQIGAKQSCQAAGFGTLVSLPIRHKDRLMGEVDLFFHAQHTLSDAERSLFEALAVHLATAMENLRLDALEKEAAIAEERGFLARELHDSIAQSLAFLKIQVQLMRDALRSGDPQQQQQVLGEIDTGVRECHGDVRELLMHFRTRANAEDIAPALQTTLRKFEHQTGLPVALAMQGHGVPLTPDLQIQVLHIVQEALSNVRKHSRAARVWLDVRQQPAWRFEIRDDGVGFDCDGAAPDETHVGLRIMRERAQRIGATLELMSSQGRGTSVVLTLPTVQRSVPEPVPVAAAA